MNRYKNFTLILLLSITIFKTCADSDIQIGTHQDEIRKKSAIWNTSFATGDVKKLLPILASDVQMTSGSGKWKTPSGAEHFFKSLFKRRPDVTWVNEIKEIMINPTWNIAYETGDWVESWSESDGKVILTGKYSAQWQRSNNVWYLHAMIFTPLNCSGSDRYCHTYSEEKESEKEVGENNFINRLENLSKLRASLTQLNPGKILDLEKEIAYFYGAQNPERIVYFYISAINEFEKLGVKADEKALKKVMIEPLKQAYMEVQSQTSLNFNPEKAAQYEFKLILAQAKEETFEAINKIIFNLYNEIFQSNSIAVRKAAMLRTFLCKYKMALLKSGSVWTEGDKTIMRAIAKESEKELSSVHSK